MVCSEKLLSFTAKVSERVSAVVKVDHFYASSNFVPGAKTTYFFGLYSSAFSAIISSLKRLKTGLPGARTVLPVVGIPKFRVRMLFFVILSFFSFSQSSKISNLISPKISGAFSATERARGMRIYSKRVWAHALVYTRNPVTLLSMMDGRS